MHSRRHGWDGDRVQSYCHDCHAAHQRKFRPRHSQLSPEARKRANARSYAHVYLKRGKLQRQPCAVCGEMEAQMHHPDYDKPLEVIWMCVDCHMDHHIAA